MSQSFFYPSQSISVPGVATAANQLLEIAALNSIDAKLTSPLAVTGPLTDAELRASAVPISAASLPLPTGAATEATLLSIDGKLTSPLAVTGPLTDAELRASAVPVSAASLPLPTGAATELTLLDVDTILDNIDTVTLQTTNASLASIDSKLTAPLSISAASLPLPAGAATEATLLSIDGTLVTSDGYLSNIDGKIPANLTVSSTRLLVDGSGVTQPISAASLPLPTGAATELTLLDVDTILDNIDTVTLQTTNASLASIDSKLTSPLSVTGPLTDTQLRATPVPVSGTVTANAGTGTFAVSAASLPLPSGAATEATLSSIDGKIPANLTVTSTRLLVDGSGVTQPISASSLPLPTGAATSAKQPALGTAGTASADVITVQGIASMTPLQVTAGAAASSSVTSVSGSASSVSLLSSNASRKGATFFNDSTATLYLKLGTTASTTSYTVQIPSNGYYELPSGTIYTGAIDGIWSSAAGAVRITELS